MYNRGMNVSLLSHDTLTSCLSRPYSEGCKGSVVALILLTLTVSSLMMTMQTTSPDYLVGTSHPSHGHCHLLLLQDDDFGPRRNRTSYHVIVYNVPTKVLPPPYVHASVVPRLRWGSSGYLGHVRARLRKKKQRRRRWRVHLHLHHAHRTRILFVDGRGITPHRHSVETKRDRPWLFDDGTMMHLEGVLLQLV